MINVSVEIFILMMIVMIKMIDDTGSDYEDRCIVMNITVDMFVLKLIVR